MSKTPIDEVPAGPALDAAVAEALGWKWMAYPAPATGKMLRGLYPPRRYKEEFAAKGDEPVGVFDVLPYSTDIGTAWELIEELKDKHKLLAILMEWPKGWFVELCHTPIKYRGIADTASLAICRAFLKANGVEYVEDAG